MSNMGNIIKWNPQNKRKLSGVLSVFLRIYRGPETKSLKTMWTFIELFIQQAGSAYTWRR